ncbi:hypothetical protein Taro_043717 [Colocasia esculenta]|uniref:Uncharacterized protein n=1 Tax=Colocasia esculenta TaxID=4460 RepID=A0A843WK42_COLES|nr:hypothetical protein [Colocasia esculenta]
MAAKWPFTSPAVFEIPNLKRLRLWRAVVGTVLRLGRMSRGVCRGAQASPSVPQEHGHGSPSIMERFKRMAPPSFKGESQPLLAES